MTKNELDKKMDEAWKSKDIQKIMGKACRKFANQLNPDELENVKLNALWKCFINFDQSKNIKFTTYLYKIVFIECLKHNAFNRKHSKYNNNILHHNISHKGNLESLIIDIMDEAQDEEERQLLLEKLQNYTIQEMSDKRPISRETVRKKLKNITKKIRSKFQ
jgi:DNA-directed RNA polymerase specialized sigma24 family protein